MDAYGWRKILINQSIRETIWEKYLLIAIKKVCRDDIIKNSLEALLASRLVVSLNKNPGFRLIGVGEVIWRTAWKIVIHTTRGRLWDENYLQPCLRMLSDATNSSLQSLAGMSSWQRNRNASLPSRLEGVGLKNFVETAPFSDSERGEGGEEQDSVWTSTKNTGKTRQNSSRNDDLRKANPTQNVAYQTGWRLFIWGNGDTISTSRNFGTPYGYATTGI